MLSALLAAAGASSPASSSPSWRCSAPPCSRSAARADVVVYNGRSQYGDEQAFRRLRGGDTGTTLELRGGTAPELFERLRVRGRRHAGGPARHHRPGQPVARQGGGPAGAGRARRRSSARCRPSTATPTATGGGCRCASARRCARPSACPPDAIDGYEDLGEAALQGPAVPAHVEQRVQPVARRRHARQARRSAATERLLRVLDGQRPADPRLGRRRAGGDRAPAAATSA